jgi:hypothetical protein
LNYSSHLQRHGNTGLQSINIKHAKKCMVMCALEIINTTQVNNGQLTQA